MANPTLSFGSVGPYVKQLQEGLNKLPSSLPKLVPDSQFGSKTKGRVQEFQSSKSLVPDGVVGPLTWEQFITAVAQGLGAGAPVQPGMNASMFDLLRPVVMTIANSHMGKVDFSVMVNGRPKGIDFIIDVFKFSANLTLTDINFREGGLPGGTWSAVPWYGIPSQKKSWCGIFAIYCYRKAGIPVSWDAAKGKIVGPLKIATFNGNFVAGMKMGTIGSVATQSHHFLIETINGPGNQPGLTTIDGNTDYGRIKRREDHRVGKDNFNYYVFTQ